MKRTIAALGLTGVMLFAAPATAHLKSYSDGANDAFQAGDVGTTAHTTPLDLANASFKEKPGKYIVKSTLQNPLDVNLLCSQDTCSGNTIESHGVLSADFYRFVDDARKNWYFVEVGQDGSGNLLAGLFKVTSTGADFQANGTATVSDDGTVVTIKVPRANINGHKKGRKIYWNATSTYWEAAGTGHCEFDTTQAFANGCVDWIPDTEDAPHKLEN
jgi:hypothetical protein